jgi:hypothetical protein
MNDPQLTAAEQDWVDDQVAQAPELTQQQIDAIARVLDGIPAPAAEHDT